MLWLRLPERTSISHCGHRLPRPQARCVDVADRLLGDTTLLRVGDKDGRAVARSDVVSLPVPGRRIMDLEEELQQLPVGEHVRVEHDLDGLRVAAMVAVGRILDVTAAVT